MGLQQNSLRLKIVKYYLFFLNMCLINNTLQFQVLVAILVSTKSGPGPYFSSKLFFVVLTDIFKYFF